MDEAREWLKDAEGHVEAFLHAPDKWLTERGIKIIRSLLAELSPERDSWEGWKQAWKDSEAKLEQAEAENDALKKNSLFWNGDSYECIHCHNKLGRGAFVHKEDCPASLKERIESGE